MDSQTKAKAEDFKYTFVFHFLCTRKPEGNKTDMKLMFPTGFQYFADIIINIIGFLIVSTKTYICLGLGD